MTEIEPHSHMNRTENYRCLSELRDPHTDDTETLP